ncbi:hypothetical protein J6590_024092 [Homalodisca vitripennis]|nr:hypothetical protein J6590_024092 [Homalodisca vitripennis]
MSVTGKPLPSPRMVSRNIHTDTSNLLCYSLCCKYDHDLSCQVWEPRGCQWASHCLALVVSRNIHTDTSNLILATLSWSCSLGKPRGMSVTGKPLPSPRMVSRNIHTDTSNLHTRYSLMVMQFAQITDHDLSCHRSGEA